MCSSKGKLGLGHRHKDVLPMKGPAPAEGLERGDTRGTAVEPPPASRKGLRKARWPIALLEEYKLAWCRQ